MKNKDIVPYTTEEGVKLGRCLTKLGVPALGPGVGHVLIHHVSRIKKVMAENKLDEESTALLNNYVARVDDVCKVIAGATEEVLNIMDGILKGHKQN